MSKEEFKDVIKRSGAIVPFNKERIDNAIYRAAVSVGGRDRERAKWLGEKVVEYLHENLPEGHISGEAPRTLLFTQSAFHVSLHVHIVTFPMNFSER